MPKVKLKSSHGHRTLSNWTTASVIPSTSKFSEMQVVLWSIRALPRAGTHVSGDHAYLQGFSSGMIQRTQTYVAQRHVSLPGSAGKASGLVDGALTRNEVTSSHGSEADVKPVPAHALGVSVELSTVSEENSSKREAGSLQAASDRASSSMGDSSTFQVRRSTTGISGDSVEPPSFIACLFSTSALQRMDSSLLRVRHLPTSLQKDVAEAFRLKLQLRLDMVNRLAAELKLHAIDKTQDGLTHDTFDSVFGRAVQFGAKQNARYSELQHESHQGHRAASSQYGGSEGDEFAIGEMLAAEIQDTKEEADKVLAYLGRQKVRYCINSASDGRQ
eukprot:scaffold582_cov385-Prasinococcus_capsulatus_cf.AAC.35